MAVPDAKPEPPRSVQTSKTPTTADQNVYICDCCCLETQKGLSKIEQGAANERVEGEKDAQPLASMLCALRTRRTLSLRRVGVRGRLDESVPVISNRSANHRRKSLADGGHTDLTFWGEASDTFRSRPLSSSDVSILGPGSLVRKFRGAAFSWAGSGCSRF